jgi:hypothetical protein
MFHCIFMFEIIPKEHIRTYIFIKTSVGIYTFLFGYYMQYFSWYEYHDIGKHPTVLSLSFQ